MALVRVYLDKYQIPRKEFDYLFTVSDDFYIAVKQTLNGSHLRTAPWARSSYLIKGPKYHRTVGIARKILFDLQASPAISVFTAYSPQDPSYFVSGFETLVKPGDTSELIEQKILLLKDAWDKTIAQMEKEGIEIWSK